MPSCGRRKDGQARSAYLVDPPTELSTSLSVGRSMEATNHSGARRKLALGRPRDEASSENGRGNGGRGRSVGVECGASTDRIAVCTSWRKDGAEKRSRDR